MSIIFACSINVKHTSLYLQSLGLANIIKKFIILRNGASILQTRQPYSHGMLSWHVAMAIGLYILKWSNADKITLTDI